MIAALLFAFACDTVRVCAGGDVTLGTNLDSTWGRIATGVTKGNWRTAMTPPDTLVSRIAPFFAGADIVLFNAEGAFGDDSTVDDKCTILAKRHHVPKSLSHCFELRQPAAAAVALRRLGDSATVVMANVANNHAHDAGDDGFVHSVRVLRDAGLLVTGADTVPSVAVTRRGDTIAVLGFSAWSFPGVDDLAAVQRLVAAAHARYGRVIVTAHMGAEGALAQRTGDSVEHYVGEDRGNPVAFARAVIDSGASLVIGHGPHVLRAAEWRDSALVFYSLGNLINYGPFNLAEPRDRGAVICATLDSAGSPSNVVALATLQITEGVVRPDSSGRARALLDSLSRLDFPSTGVTVDTTGAVKRPTISPLPAPDSTSNPHPSEPDVPPATALRAARSVGRARSR